MYGPKSILALSKVRVPNLYRALALIAQSNLTLSGWGFGPVPVGWINSGRYGDYVT